MLIAAYLGAALVLGLVLGFLVGRPVLVALLLLVLAGALVAGAVAGSGPLVIRMVDAQPADPTRHARLHNLAEGLCLAKGLPHPQLLVVDDPSSNALACGRGPKDARIIVTSGLLEATGAIELEGLLARELVQIKSGEAAHNTRVVGLAGMFAAWTDWGARRRAAEGSGGGALAGVALVLLPLAPLAGAILRSLCDEGRDTRCDLEAVETTRYPPGLIAALETMTEGRSRVGRAGRATAHLWVAEPLAPIPGEGFAARAWRGMETHEPLESRIAALREL